MIYRVYLLNEAGLIRAAETLSAAYDEEAVAVADVVYDACSDTFTGYEVWRGAERIAAERAGRIGDRLPSLETLVERHQEAAIELEERLQRTFQSIANSHRLMQTIDAIERRRLQN